MIKYTLNIIQIVLIALKALGLINWSWWLVLSIWILLFAYGFVWAFCVAFKREYNKGLHDRH